MLKISNKLLGVITSYALMGIGVFYSLIITPALISNFGKLEYGNYQYFYAVFAYLNMFDLGLGTMAVKYAAIMDDEDSRWISRKYLSTYFVLTILASIVVFIAGIIIFVFIRKTPHADFENFFLVIVSMILCSVVKYVLTYFYGIINGKELFAIANAIQILQYVSKMIFSIYLIKLEKLDFIGLISIELGTLLGALLISTSYCIKKLKLKLKLDMVDGRTLKSSLKSCKEFFVGSIASFLNDKMIIVVIGNLLSKLFVTVYTVSYTVFSNFSSLGGIVSSIYLPSAVRLVNKKASKEEFETFCINPGRIQFFLCASILGGFVVVGKEFLILWLGYYDSNIYITCVIMMIANTLSVIMSISAKLIIAETNHLQVFSRGMLLLSFMNILASGVGIKLFGYIGVPISALLTSICIYGYYFPKNINKIFGVRYIIVFRQIGKGLLPAILVTTVVSYFIKSLMSSIVLRFVISGIAFVLIDVGLAYLFGINVQERQIIHTHFRKKGIK